MDNKRLIVAMIVGMVVLLGYYTGVKYLETKTGYKILTPPDTTKSVASSTQPATMPVTIQIDPKVAGSAATQGTPSTAAVVGGEARTLVIGSTTATNANDPKAVYRMAVTLSTRGAAVENVELNEFKKQIGKDDKYTFQSPAGTEASLSTNDVLVGGAKISTRNADWKVEAADNQSATFSLDVTGPNGENLRVTKKYTLDNNAAVSGGYELTLDTTITNLGKGNVPVALAMNGPIAPPFEIERGPERQVLHAYVDATSKQVLVRHTVVEQLSKEHPTVDITHDTGAAQHKLAWFGANGAYFNAIFRPLDMAGSTTSWIASATGFSQEPDIADPHLRKIVTSFTTTPVEVAAGAASTMSAKVYFGPKKRDILKSDYYVAYPIAYDETLVLSSGICGICTFQWLIGILVWLLNFFHYVVRDWGLSIIVLVLCVRTLLHPITRKSQENMLKMGKMGPKMEEIKKKYADDKEAMNKAMMGVYKEQGAAPILGCLPMFLQMPIWIALYASLQSTFELRQAPFLYNLTWIHDLSKPDHLIQFPTFTLFGLLPISGLNIIPFLLAVVFFLQQHFTPKPPASTPEQAQQQAMMKWMTLIFPVFLYNAPAGLTIYILTSTSFGIIESKIIRDKLKKLDDGKATSTVIDVAPATGRVNRQEGKVNRREPEKRKGLMARLEEMQAKVAEFQKEQDEKKRKDKDK